MKLKRNISIGIGSSPLLGNLDRYFGRKLRETLVGPVRSGRTSFDWAKATTQHGVNPLQCLVALHHRRGIERGDGIPRQHFQAQHGLAEFQADQSWTARGS